MYYPFIHPIRTLLICPGIPLALMLYVGMLVALVTRNRAKEKRSESVRVAMVVAAIVGVPIACLMGFYVSLGYWVQ